jgi:hypothetical protein
MTVTIEDFLDDLRELGESLSNPQQMLANIGDAIVEHMRANVPVDTGRLKGSIEWSFNGDTSIQFSMLEHGLYQNYGVGPNQFTANPKPFSNEFGGLRDPWAEPEFGVIMGPGYQQPRQFGMQARKFYDREQISKYIGDQFLEEITIDF